MPAIVRPVNQGLLVADPRWSAASIVSDSSVSESGPLPGAAVAQADTAMTIETAGTTTLADTLYLKALRAGDPKPGGASFAWHFLGEDWRGWDAPVAPTSWEYIDRQTSDTWHRPQAVALDDGTVLVVADKSARYVYAFVRTAYGSWSAGVEVADVGTLSVAAATHPCLVKLASGRVLCFYWRELTGSLAQVDMSFTDDGGATWTEGARSVLPSAIDTASYVPKRLRVAEASGRVLLLAELEGPTFDEVHQYASSDLGSTFKLVDALDDACYGLPTVAVIDGVFVVGVVKNAAASIYNQPQIRRLATPFGRLSDASAVTVDAGGSVEWASPLSDMTAGGHFGNGELALWADEDGTLYLAGLDADDYFAGYVVHSDDGGLTWTTTGHGTAAGDGGTWWYWGDGGTRPMEFSVVSIAGQALMVLRPHNAGATGAPEYSLHAITLGGYSTVTLPLWKTSYTAAMDQIGWTYTYLPFDLPEEGTSPWTASYSGGVAVTLTANGLRVGHSGVTDQAVWTAPATSTFAQGLLALLDVDATSPVSGQLWVSLSDGAHSYRVTVEVSATAIIVTDTEAGAVVTTLSTTDGAAGVQLLVALGNTDGAAGDTGKVNVWYRVRSSPEDRQWTLVTHSSTLHRGTYATCEVKFGTLSGAASGHANFRPHLIAMGSATGSTLYESYDNPGDLIGRPFSATGSIVTSGLRVLATTGPAYVGDRWTITPRAEYPLEHALPDAHPSPAQEWRSVDTSNDQSITWDWSSGFVGSTHYPLGPVLGLYCGRINWRMAELHGLNAAGVPSKIADIDTATGQSSLAYTRTGTTITVRVSSDSPWWTENALVGGYFDFGGGDLRRIVANSSGTWRTGTVAVRLVIEDYSGLPTSGTGAILPRDYTLVLPNAGTSAYRGYTLKVLSQDTAEGFFKAGVLLLGNVLPFASPYSWGRAIETASLNAMWEGRTGARRARRLNAYNRRAVELPWDDEVRQRPVLKSNPTPTATVPYTAGPAWGVPADTLPMIGGVIERLGGQVGLCVFLPEIATGSSAKHLNHPDQMLYGRVRTSPWRLDHVLGQERDTDVWRGATLRIEEEL